MRILLTLCYDGTNFFGWQRQKNGVSVQETIENAIFSLTGEKVTVTGSGRTDSGVHALGQTAHFDTNSTIPPEKFYKALNPFLPNGVKAISSKLVDKNFNACKTAKKKTYAYSFYFSEVENPLFERYALKLDKKPDFSLMQKTISVLIGEHDFKAFCATNSSAKTTVRTIYSIEIKNTEIGFDLLVTGNGFLYNMVRILAGALIDVGLGIKTVSGVENALNTKNRSVLGKTLKPSGLKLVSVEY